MHYSLVNVSRKQIPVASTNTKIPKNTKKITIQHLEAELCTSSVVIGTSKVQCQSNIRCKKATSIKYLRVRAAASGPLLTQYSVGSVPTPCNPCILNPSVGFSHKILSRLSHFFDTFQGRWAFKILLFTQIF